MQRKARKRCRRRRGRGKTSNGRAPFTNVASAPAGTAQFLQHYTRFRGEGEALGIECCLPIVEIHFQTGSIGPDKNPLYFQSLNSPSVMPSCAAALGLTKVVANVQNVGTFPATNRLFTKAEYVSPVFDLIGTAFTRWKVNKCAFHYTPQASTLQKGRCVFAFADDPGHPVIFPSLNHSDSTNVTEANNPTQTQLLALGDSMAFPPWLPWTLDVSDRVKQNELYTAVQVQFHPTEVGASPVYADAYISGFVAQLRSSCFGAVGCRAESFETEAFLGGIVWMELDFTLIEFCPITAGYVDAPPLPGLHALKAKSKESGREIGKMDTKVPDQQERFGGEVVLNDPPQGSQWETGCVDLRVEHDLERAQELLAQLGYSPTELSRLARVTPNKTTKGAPSGEAD